MPRNLGGAGRLVSPGDVGALQATLEELVGEESMLAAASPRTVEEEARELESLYASLRGAAGPEASAHVAS